MKYYILVTLLIATQGMILQTLNDAQLAELIRLSECESRTVQKEYLVKLGGDGSAAELELTLEYALSHVNPYGESVKPKGLSQSESFKNV